MKVTTKSILIARKKYSENEELPYLLEIKLFDINNPHLTAELPKKELEYKGIEGVDLIGLKVSYYIRGSDLVINDAGSVTIEQKEDFIVIRKT